MLTRIGLEHPPQDAIFESEVVKTHKEEPLVEGPTVVTENVDMTQGKANRFLEDLSRPVHIEHNKKHSYPFDQLKTPHRNLTYEAG